MAAHMLNTQARKHATRNVLSAKPMILPSLSAELEEELVIEERGRRDGCVELPLY